MITIKKYNKTYAKQWDDFIIASNNGTIFQLQKFLNYHITRKFTDYSILIMQNNKIIAAIPGAVKIKNNKKIYYSHPGASYGGLIIKKNLNFNKINQIIELLNNYLKKKKFQSVFLINSPSIYWQFPEQTVDYLLQWHKYHIQELYISHATDITKKNKIEDLLSKRKKRYIANDQELKNYSFTKLKNQQDLRFLYGLLEKSKLKFKTKPTHSLGELKKLTDLFPKEVEIYISKLNSTIVGGCIIFHATINTSMIFYNIIDSQMTESQLSALQLYNCMKICKKRGSTTIDFGVSHTPEHDNPLQPKLSLIQFKEQFGATGIMRIAYKKELL